MQKLYTLIATVLCSLLFSSSFAQKGAVAEIKTVKVPMGQAKLMSQKIKSVAYHIDRRGILMAKKGYHLLYLKKTKVLLIKPIDAAIIEPAKENGTITIGATTYWCGRCPSCDWSTSGSSSNVTDGGTTYTCGGNCVCQEISSTPIENLQYQTANGDYSNNWDDL